MAGVKVGPLMRWARRLAVRARALARTATKTGERGSQAAGVGPPGKRMTFLPV